MAITPDVKNWTWVLERACPECAFDASTLSSVNCSAALRANADAWPPLLRHPDVRTRPRPDVWSALEYACHVRDVFVLFNERLRMMLEQNDPTYQNWDQDATAVGERYGEQDPDDVAPALLHAADALVERLDGVHGEQWERTGSRSDGARFTVRSFTRYLIHDPVHHLHDVRAGYRSLASG